MNTQTATALDLKTFDFPQTSGLDIAFPTFGTIPELKAEAERRGFYNGNTPFNKLFSSLFFNGGKVTFREGIDADFKKKAWSYCRVLMGSFSPKHEDKEAVCAMLMSELLIPN